MGLEPAPTVPPVPELRRLPSDQADWIMELFRLLGGTASTPRLRPGPWDLAFEGGLVVELDEELHFNRYRRLTLDREWTKPLPWREDYLSYSDQFENECLRAATWGSRWTNPSCESLFGPPGRAGDLASMGAPRWKQRALYDAMKDAAVLTGAGMRLARLATVDVVADAKLGDVLEGRAIIELGALGRFLERRSA